MKKILRFKNTLLYIRMNKQKITLWKEIDWKLAYTTLKELQAKLYKSLKNGEPTGKIHLQIVTSFSARAVAIRTVTSNAGGKTRGVDNILWTTDSAKFDAIKALGDLDNSYAAKSVKRVWIPKADGKTMRPLGIPTMFDRAVQTLYNFVLDVHQEHNANPRSFGFRRGRSPKQAINYVWKLASGAGKRFLLSVDIAKAYDSVSHKWLLANIPINRKVLKQWLKASINDKGNLTTNKRGVPQGGPISPTIFNITMNGVEEIIMQEKGCFPVRFADDILVLSNSKEQLEKVKENLQEFLKPRGLTLNEGKTMLRTIEEGVNFLGYNIKEYPTPAKAGWKRMPTKKGQVLAKPAEKSIENFKNMIREVFKTYKKSSAARLILNLNPKIRGWANYFNAGGGWTEAKNKLGHWLFIRLKKWVYAKHRGNSGKRKLLAKYFKRVQRRKSYFNAWTFFAIAEGKEILLADIQEILVVRENELHFADSPNPYNPEDAKYIDSRLKRMIKNEQRLSKLKVNLLRKQDGYCPLCGQIIILDQEAVERDHIVPISEGGKDTMKNTALVHKTCHRKKTSWERKWRAHQRKQVNNQNKSA